MELGKVEGNGPNDIFPGVAVITLLSVIGVLINIRSVVTHNISAFRTYLLPVISANRDRGLGADKELAKFASEAQKS